MKSSFTVASAVLLLVASVTAVATPTPFGTEFTFDAVLVQMAGPGAGVVGVEVDKPAGPRIVLPGVQVVFVRAYVYDGNGIGVNGLKVTGEVEWENDDETDLEFSAGNLAGVYNSQRLSYRGGALTMEAEVDDAGLAIEKTYVPWSRPVEDALNGSSGQSTDLVTLPPPPRHP